MMIKKKTFRLTNDFVTENEHDYETMEDILEVCDSNANDTFERDMEMVFIGNKNIYIIFKDPSSAQEFCNYCEYEKIKNTKLIFPYTLTSTHHWSEKDRIVLIVYSDNLCFKSKDQFVTVPKEDYLKVLIEFLGCLIEKRKRRHCYKLNYEEEIVSLLHINGERCSLALTKKILEHVYSLNMPYIYELFQLICETAKMLKPHTIGDALRIIGFPAKYPGMGEFKYIEYPDSVLFFCEPLDDNICLEYDIPFSPNKNRFIVYYDR